MQLCLTFVLEKSQPAKISNIIEIGLPINEL